MKTHQLEVGDRTIDTTDAKYYVSFTDFDMLPNLGYDMDNDTGLVVTIPNIINKTIISQLNNLTYDKHHVMETFMSCKANIEYRILLVVPSGAKPHNIIHTIREVISI